MKILTYNNSLEIHMKPGLFTFNNELNQSKENNFSSIILGLIHLCWLSMSQLDVPSIPVLFSVLWLTLWLIFYIRTIYHLESINNLIGQGQW